MDAGIWFVRFDVHDYQIPDLLACAPRSVLDGPEEVVTISHVAQSRGVFADGAVQAALFLDGCEPGYYTMTDMLKGKMQCL